MMKYLAVALLVVLGLVATTQAQLLPQAFYQDAADAALKTYTQDAKLFGFTTGAATTFARFSGAAYCARANAAALQRWNCQTCRNLPTVSELSVFQASTTRGFVGYDASNRRIIVAFSGTPGKSIATWAANLKANPMNYGRCSNCKVHSGFMEGFNDVRTTMINAVRNLFNKYKVPVVVTGHSLGGAQALYAIAEIKANGFTLAAEHYTFGAPRAGNTQFANYINGLGVRVFRLVNNADLVPHVPPMWSSIATLGQVDYRHNAMQVFHRNGQYTTCSATDGEDPKCPSALLPVSVSDHLEYANYKFGTDNPDCASGWKSEMGAEEEPEVLIPATLTMSDLYPGAAEVDAINMLRVIPVKA